MITRFGMAPRLPGASIVDFQRHWRTSHADAAGSIPGVVRYHQNHGVLRDGRYLLGYPGFDACSELDFSSVEAMDSGFASETYQTTVRDDERAFVEKSRFSMMVANRTSTRGGTGRVKLLTLYRAHPSAGVESLAATLGGAYAEAVAGLGTGHLVYAVEPAAHASIPAAFDAADALWFGDLAALETALASEDWSRGVWQLSGIASGVARLAATVVEVV